jgi:hypothetical protein
MTANIAPEEMVEEAATSQENIQVSVWRDCEKPQK